MKTESIARISLCVLFLPIAFVLHGCSGKEEAAFTGDVLKMGNGAEVKDLDPQLVTGIPGFRVNSALFEGLCSIDPKTLDPMPGVAKSWELSEDGVQYTFNLRKNAKWSNGDPVTAQDFVFAWKRMLSPSLAAEYAYLLYSMKNAEPYQRGEIDDFSKVGVKALDDYTLQVTLESPTPYFLTLQNHQAWYPVHEETIRQYGGAFERGNTWTREGHHVGNGPFKLETWSPNELIRVVKNDQYWDAGNVGLDAIEYYPISNEQTEERSFRAGELHITETVPVHRIPVYKENDPHLLVQHPYLGIYYYRVNVTRDGLKDPRVRRALAMCVDRRTIAENILKGGQKPAGAYVPPGIGDYKSPTKIQFDPEAAKKLLAEAGHPNGKGLPPVEILYNTQEAHKKIAEAIQQMWKQHLGVDARLINQDWKVYLATLDSLDYDVARSGWIGDVVDPINFLECFLTGNGNNRTGWSNEEYDALIRQAYTEPDVAKRRQLMRDAEKILIEELPMIPIYFYTRNFLMAPEVQGYQPNILGYMRWQDFSLAEKKVAAN